MKKGLMANRVDNVAVALTDIDRGEKVNLVLASGEVVKDVIAREPIPFRHKIATGAVAKGNKVIRYGEIIGLAEEDIAEGSYVHTHNVTSIKFPIRSFRLMGSPVQR